jgi:hypothetical protein
MPALLAFTTPCRYVHSSRNRLLQDKASEELKQQRATKGQNWNNRYKQYQDKNLVPDGAEFKLYLPKAKALVSCSCYCIA